MWGKPNVWIIKMHTHAAGRFEKDEVATQFPMVWIPLTAGGKVALACQQGARHAQPVIDLSEDHLLS